MKRRLLILACVLAAIGALAADSLITWRVASRVLNRPVAAPAFNPEPDDPLSRFRTERSQLRARQEAELNDIIYSGSSDAETVARAKGALLEQLESEKQELTLEGLLQSRGFGDVLVSISGGSCNVLVRGEALAQRETAVILDSVMRETGLTGGNVKIIPVK